MSDEGDRTGGDGVDDVLAAIRRLVTEEEHGRRRDASGAAGSLILTADMRVEDSDAAEPAPTPDPDRNGSENVESIAEHRAQAEFDDRVRAIVREELEGALGDRITSGLRKMIRREVTRALNARMQD